MIKITATFIGQDGSLGYRTGHTYDLEVEKMQVLAPQRCPYGSIEAFLRNWSPVEVFPAPSLRGGAQEGEG